MTHELTFALNGDRTAYITRYNNVQ